MEVLYAPDMTFTPQSAQHGYWLLYAAISTIFWLFLGKNAKTPEEEENIGWYMGCIGLVTWVYSQVMMLAFNPWEIMSGLPLHLCYFLNFVLPFMVKRRNFEVFDWVYPIVMAGCLQALFTPDLKSSFPNHFSIKYWLVHIGLVQCALYAIVVYGFRPTFKGIFKCLLGFNIYAAVIWCFNQVLNTNFMYLREKPPGTILDKFGDFPYYIIATEFLALVLFVIVWLPFGFLKRKVDVIA
jgi:hypothetical integral membrane protein (TIGR02206 family)